jgi:flavodoxin
MNAGFAPHYKNPERPALVYGGFKVTREDNGDSKIVYVLGGYVGAPERENRKTVCEQMRLMEKALSRKGWKVTLFEPTEGADFWLKVTSEDAEYQLPGETEDDYFERMETRSDRAAWSRQDN